MQNNMTLDSSMIVMAKQMNQQMKKEQHKTVRAENTAQANKAQAVRSSLLKIVHQLEFIVQVKLESDFWDFLLSELNAFLG